MTAYMDLNGVPASGNRWLFTEVLRDRWGFDGFVVSDANAVRNLVTHGFAADLADAAARGTGVGVDLEMAMTEPAYAHLPEAVERGAVSVEAVRRLRPAHPRGQAAARPVRPAVRRRGTGPDGAADPAHRAGARGGAAVGGAAAQ